MLPVVLFVKKTDELNVPVLDPNWNTQLLRLTVAFPRLNISMKLF